MDNLGRNKKESRKKLIDFTMVQKSYPKNY